MAFAKGQSGNPGGRPKVTLPDGRSLQDLAREHTADAVNALVAVMGDDDSPPAAVVSAASAILDRGWGRPKQELDASDDLKSMLADIIAQRRQKAAELGNGD